MSNSTISLKSNLIKIIKLDLFRLLFPIIILCLSLSLLSPNFLTVNNLTNILVNAAPLALAATGLTLVIICGDLDLSVGSNMALVSTASALLMANFGLSIFLAFGAGLLIGAFVGFVNGLLSVKINIPSFIVTLAMMSVARGIALVLSDGSAVTNLPESVTNISSGRFLGLSFIIWIPILIIPIIGYLLSRTVLGLNIYSIGGNKEAAILAGVPESKTRILALTISGFMAGFAGIISTSRLGVGSPIIAEDLILDAIAAVVIGGTSLFGGIGKITGTILGVLLIAIIRNGLVLLNVSPFYQKVAIGIVILIASIIDALGRKRNL
jgi:ribose transport system permease protein